MNKMRFWGNYTFVCLLILCTALSEVKTEWHDESGPWVIATKGEVWPKPFQRRVAQSYWRLIPHNFNFEITEQTCDIVENAVTRYKQVIQMEYDAALKFIVGINANETNIVNNFNDPKYRGFLNKLKIVLKRPCELYPYMGINETYHLIVPENTPGAVLISDSVWGILRGLETFSQLLHASDVKPPGLLIKCQEIFDKPKLSHRGLLLDTSRHYIPVADIKRVLEAMSYNKLNVFHWHITDDNSFPYVSSVYPSLSKLGAYHPSMIYDLDDIKAIIEYARLRGIRVMPEFDTPGHTKSWGLAFPEYLTKCYDYKGKPNGKMGPMDPTNNDLYPFLDRLFKEIVQRFPDKYLHIGGDEVLFDCWSSNPDIQKFMKNNNISDFAKLEDMFIQKLLVIIDNHGVIPIVWQEVFDNGVRMKPGTVIHVWKGGDWRGELRRVSQAGFPMLLSSCWYLDHIGAGGDWFKYYQCDPFSYIEDRDQNKEDLVKQMLGGETCMWSEFVDKNNLHSRVWPRASAAAERLWSHVAENKDKASQRLEEHACRMNKRGIPAQPPNGAGYCIY